MEHQKTINLLGNITNQLSKFRAKDWFEITDDKNGVHSADAASVLNLCDYKDTYTLVKGTIPLANSTAADADANNII